MRPESTHPGHRVSWPALVALVLVPLLAVAALVGLGGNSFDQRVSAAVVNLDEAVELDGQLVPLGRQLAAAILERDGDNISWTLADAKNAKDGLQSGAYAAVVTIPKEFSAAATSFSANDADVARQATVGVRVSDNAPVTDAAVAQEIARLAASTINSTLTESYLDNIYVGFNQVADQFTTIVDGAQQLSDGASQLADGTGQASDGAAQLSDGLNLLSDNSAELVGGGEQLVDGSAQFADGVAQLSDGADALASGASELSGGLDQFARQTPLLADGVDDLATGAAPLLGAIPDYTRGTKEAIGGVAGIKGGVDAIISGLDGAGDAGEGPSPFDPLIAGTRGIATGLDAVDEQLKAFASGKAEVPEEALAARAQVKAAFSCPVEDPATCGLLQQYFEAGVDGGFQAGFQTGTGTASAILNTPDPTTTTSFKGGVAQLLEGVEGLPAQVEEGTKEQLAELSAGLQQVSDGAGRLITETRPLVDNADQLGSGATQLLAGINELNAQVAPLPAGVAQLSTGASQLSDGASQLAGGVAQLDDGASELTSGVSQFVGGVRQYTAGVDSAASGVNQFADAIVQLDDGAEQLAEGTSTFATELAKGAKEVPTYSPEAREKLSTVVASPVAQSDDLVDGSRGALVALVLVGVLWLASLATFVVSRPVPSDVLTSSASNAGLWARTLAAPALITAVEGLVFGLIGGVVLELPAGRLLSLMGLLAVLGVVFALVNHVLTAWLGNVGRGISLLLLAISVVLGLTSATPGVFDAVAAFSPVHNGLLMVRTWISDGTGMAGYVGGMLLVALIAAILSVAAIAGRRRLTARQFRSRVAASHS